MKGLAEEIQKGKAYNLSSNKPEPRIIRVLIDGSIEMEKRLSGGLNQFFYTLDQVSLYEPEIVWKYIEAFSRNICNVGPALVSDFFNEIAADLMNNAG